MERIVIVKEGKLEHHGIERFQYTYFEHDSIKVDPAIEPVRVLSASIYRTIAIKGEEENVMMYQLSPITGEVEIGPVPVPLIGYLSIRVSDQFPFLISRFVESPSPGIEYVTKIVLSGLEILPTSYDRVILLPNLAVGIELLPGSNNPNLTLSARELPSKRLRWRLPTSGESLFVAGGRAFLYWDAWKWRAY